jgi:hypothetical protein
VSETVLEGGDLNHVVRIGDTVRRPQDDNLRLLEELRPSLEAALA